ncbi:Uncharacterised protein [Vibrio cholerae]|nr:Uncharacterised protein [Vibrio cholerae]
MILFYSLFMNEMRLGYVRLFVSWCLRQKD